MWTCLWGGGNWGAVESAPSKNFGSMCFQLMLQNGYVGVALLQEETSSLFHEWIGRETKTQIFVFFLLIMNDPLKKKQKHFP